MIYGNILILFLRGIYFFSRDLSFMAMNRLLLEYTRWTFYHT